MKFRYNWIYSVANFIYYKIDYRISCLTVLVITALVISSLSLSCKQDNADSYYKRGVINADKGDWEAALNNLNKAIEINPNYAVAYTGRGLSKIKIGLKDSGCLDLSKAGEMGNSKAYDAIKKYCQ